MGCGLPTETPEKGKQNKTRCQWPGDTALSAPAFADSVPSVWAAWPFTEWGGVHGHLGGRRTAAKGTGRPRPESSERTFPTEWACQAAVSRWPSSGKAEGQESPRSGLEEPRSGSEPGELLTRKSEESSLPQAWGLCSEKQRVPGPTERQGSPGSPCLRRTSDCPVGSTVPSLEGCGDPQFLNPVRMRVKEPGPIPWRVCVRGGVSGPRALAQNSIQAPTWPGSSGPHRSRPPSKNRLEL